LNGRGAADRGQDDGFGAHPPDGLMMDQTPIDAAADCHVIASRIFANRC
jgi:hypothetical protein